ncbi:MAG: hypothetical protein AAF191_08490, partial [Verrucomicrobiota bacterium]
IENIVREQFPHDLRNWPLLQAFNFEGYQIGDGHFVIVLRDKLSGVPAGPGDCKPFPHTDHPELPPKPEHAELWQTYLNTKFDLRSEDAAIILPIHDCGKNDASKDFALFSAEERELWHRQLSIIIPRQHSLLQRPNPVQPVPPPQVVYNVSGTNTRININSVDSSVNTVETEIQIFEKLRECSNEKIADEEQREAILTAIGEMEQSCGSKGFLAKYQAFMGTIADHIETFSFALPQLANLISG